jgi:hypothetical protein
MVCNRFSVHRYGYSLGNPCLWYTCAKPYWLVYKMNDNHLHYSLMCNDNEVKKVYGWHYLVMSQHDKNVHTEIKGMKVDNKNNNDHSHLTIVYL